jgi:hypothetical protein
VKPVAGSCKKKIKPEERIKTPWDRHTPFLERPRLQGKLCKKSQTSAYTLQMQSDVIFISTKNDKAHALQSFHLLTPNAQSLTLNQYLSPHPTDIRASRRVSEMYPAQKET